MNSKILFYIGILFFLFAGCSTTEQNAKLGEGTVTYTISYPDKAKLGIKAALYPKTMDLYFKDEKATFVTSSGLGTIQLIRILDHETKKFTTLLIDALRENYAYSLSPAEITENENTPKYTFEFTDKTKIIAGLECKKAIVKNTTDNTSFDVYYYDKIKFYYWNSPYKDFNFLLLEYTYTMDNLTMDLVASKVDLTTPVDPTFFEIHGNYNWLNQKSFNAYLNNL